MICIPPTWLLAAGATSVVAGASRPIDLGLKPLGFALIGAALANVAVVHLAWGRRLGDWDRTIPPAARLTAAASLGLWLSAAAMGRLIAYA